MRIKTLIRLLQAQETATSPDAQVWIEVPCDPEAGTYHTVPIYDMRICGDDDGNDGKWIVTLSGIEK